MRSIFVFITVLLLSCFGAEVSNAQCMMEALPLNQVIDGSAQAFEGEVTSRFCYRDENTGTIYTEYTVSLSETLGRNGETEAHITALGGVVEGYAQMVYPSLQLAIGDKGLFLCDEKQGKLQVYGISQGFYKYSDNNAVNAAGEKIEINTLKHKVEAKKGALFTPVEGAQGNDLGLVKSGQSISITSVSPTVLTAGTSQVLTIKGAGFGNTQQSGRVSFKNANNGGSDYINVPSGPHILTWSDTLIKVTVPTATVYGQYVAGTGPVKVSNASGAAALSQVVNIKYAKSEIYYSGDIQNTNIANVNGEGGYTFYFGPALFGDELVKNSFARALHNWKCSAKINMEPDMTAPSNVGIGYNDNISYVELDVNHTLPNGILGATVISYTSCFFDNELHWVMTEMDMLINPDFVWHHGELPVESGKYDFESAILHELGHAHLIQHNMNENSVMYYKLTTGQARRNLHSDSDIGATSHVLQDSENLSQGCYSPMIPVEDDYCNLQFTDVDENDFDELSVYPNPSTGQFFIDGLQSRNQVRVQIYNTMGAMVLEEFPTAERIAVDLSSMASGVYWVKVFEGDQLGITKKVMVLGN